MLTSDKTPTQTNSFLERSYTTLVRRLGKFRRAGASGPSGSTQSSDAFGTYSFFPSLIDFLNVGGKMAPGAPDYLFLA